MSCTQTFNGRGAQAVLGVEATQSRSAQIAPNVAHGPRQTTSSRWVDGVDSEHGYPAAYAQPALNVTSWRRSDESTVDLVARELSELRSLHRHAETSVEISSPPDPTQHTSSRYSSGSGQTQPPPPAYAEPSTPLLDSSPTAWGGSLDQHTRPLPTVESLKIISPFLDGLTEGERLAWAEDVIRLNVWSSRFPRGATDASRPPAYSRSKTISLEELLQRAVLLVISLTAQSDLSAAPSAAYLKGKLLASGLCEEYLPQDHQRAVKEFKLAAGRGEARAWSALGERYESLGQTRMARECYERGIEEGDCESTYRIGIGYLLGNLDLSRDPSRALSLLQRSAKTATIDSPHPAFTYGLILADLLPLPTPLPPSLHPLHTIPTSGAYLNRLLLAQRHIRRAAYLHYSPAQLFLGKAYERSLLGLPYNPQMSVGWYLLASAEGEEEADMALSRWYLCGAGEFVKVDEVEARRYAESAADRGHPDGCFAMGYYFELGIGGRKNEEEARKWYRRAILLGNTEAPQRLTGLQWVSRS